MKLFVFKKIADGNEVLTGIEMAEAQLPDGRHCPFFHAVKQICQIAVIIVVHLERMDFWLTEQYAAGAAEHIDKPAIFQREQRVQNMKDSTFITYP